MPVATIGTKGLAPAYSVPLRAENADATNRMYEICALNEFSSIMLFVSIKQYTGEGRAAFLSAVRHNTSNQILYAYNNPITSDTIDFYINNITNKVAVRLDSYFSLCVIPLAYNGIINFNLKETTDDGYVKV